MSGLGCRHGDADRAACLGASTTSVREFGSHMEECRLCGTAVAFDLVDHPFFGFRAGCEHFTFPPEKAVDGRDKPGHDDAGRAKS